MAKYRRPSAAQATPVVVTIADEDALRAAKQTGWNEALDELAPLLERTKAGREALDAARQKSY